MHKNYIHFHNRLLSLKLYTCNLMRFFLSILFLVLLIPQTFNKCWILVDYYLNAKAYIKTCENKSRPMLHCNGKCQMMKKMQQQENKDQQVPERKSGFNETVLTSPSLFEGIHAPEYISLITHQRRWLSQFHTSILYSDIFHPPCI